MTKKESQEKIRTMLNDYRNYLWTYRLLKEKEGKKPSREVVSVSYMIIAFVDTCEALGIVFEKNR